MRFDYDMLGASVHTESMEAGESWMLNDVAGKPIYQWDNRGHRLHTTYDELRRPVASFLTDSLEAEILVGKTVYGEGQPNAEVSNLRGKVRTSFDGAGVVTTDDYDFKGNLLGNRRQLAADYKRTPNWETDVSLEEEVFSTSTQFDALNRPILVITPDNSTIRPTYNEANLLERVEANLRGSASATIFVNDIDYNATPGPTPPAGSPG